MRNLEAKHAQEKAWYERNREARVARMKAYYERNRAAILARAKVYREQNREVIAAKDKAYNERNRDAISAQKKTYYERNRAAILARVKVYTEQNPDLIRERNRRRRARLAGVERIPWTEAEVYALTDGACAYCGASASTIDHVVPISDGGADAFGNLVGACQPCNSSKQDRGLTWTLERAPEFRAWWVATLQTFEGRALVLGVLTLTHCERALRAA